jgi:hypothetical protein
MEEINNININFQGNYNSPDSINILVNFGSVVHNILYGNSNYFISIWADSNAGMSNGKIYFTSNDELQVLDLAENKVVDRVTQSIKGAPNETLEQDNIGDLNIGG